MKRIVNFIWILLCTVVVHASGSGDGRQVENFDFGWRFSLDPHLNERKAMKQSFDDEGWKYLNLPHDWAVEGYFSEKYPSGPGGGALPGGVGWYRKHFKIDKKDAGKRIYIHFDGAYMNTSVYFNGKKIGWRPYGYIPFEYELTSLVNFDGDNVILVKVDNSDQPNSRWYSGCGIYRNVYLIKTGGVHVVTDGTYIKTTSLTDKAAELEVVTTLCNKTGKQQTVEVKSILKDRDGKVVDEADSKPIVAPTTDSNTDIVHTLDVANPHLWNLDDTYMYTLFTEIKIDGFLVDSYETPYGIRSIKFTADKGFFLNGKNMKINGVCLHHDLGCLGAAVNNVALHRQLKMLKDMGCNGIRCTHNPPAPELLNMCDTMGFVVMDEAFDMWRRRKTENDYARFFDKWHDVDLKDMVRRDRNHPCIVMWSIGNEVLEQWNSANADTLSLAMANLVLNFGHNEKQEIESGKKNMNTLLTEHLIKIVKDLDQTRPVTAGCNEPSPANNLFKAEGLDIIGYNYHNQNIPDVPKNFPGKPFIITESVSALATRGYYRMPSDSMFIWPKRWDIPFEDATFSCSSYDNCHVPWGSTHEETLDVVKYNDFVAGQFLWTGFDYIGEPTPFGWPARSSFFGVVDLAGFPKDAYYLYQSEWSDKPVLHLFPHWTWDEGDEIDMWCYYNNADEVELFVNGESRGVRKKTEHCYHAVWNKVFYRPGSVKVVARKNGAVVGTKEIFTAGKPRSIRLTADKTVQKADRRDLTYITVEILDQQGHLCPDATDLVRFVISQGNAKIIGVDNGSPISSERFKIDCRRAFYGKCLVVVQNNGDAGKIKLTASSGILTPASVEIDVIR